MKRIVEIDLVGDEDIMTKSEESAWETKEQESYAEPLTGLVEISYDDSVIQMPAAYKALWDQWIRR